MTTAPTTTLRDRALRDVDTHLLALVHESGLNRQMLFRAPGRWEFWFEIITSPGLLTVHGDMGSYVFARESDMVGWFIGSSHNGQANVSYWAEKCVSHGGRRGLREYSPAKMRSCLDGQISDLTDGLHPARYGQLRRAVAEVMEDVDDADEHAVIDALRGFDWEGDYPFEECWDWDIHEYTYQFQWTCHTLLRALEKYRAGDYLEPIRRTGWADVSDLVNAWNVPGPAPAYHHAQQARLAREWPTLHHAITTITTTTKGK